MTQKTPTLAEVLEAAVAGALDDARVVLPGRIESYNSSTRRATVQVLPMDGFVGEDGARRAVAAATLQDVPVGFVGSGSIRIGFDPSPGDQCWLLFASSSIAKLKATGRIAPYDPGDDRHHHIADAIAIPWVVVGDAGTAPLIWFTGTQVQLGAEGAAQAVIRGTAYRGAEDLFLAALNVFLAPAGPLVVYINGIKAIADPTNAFTPAILTAIGVLYAALQAFQSSIAGSLSLSNVVKVP